jgi:hypothetical protein
MNAPNKPTEPWQQRRLRMLVGTVFMVAALVGLMTWLLLHPSSPTSPARKVKHAIFGQRITEAVERSARRETDQMEWVGDLPGSEQGQPAAPATNFGEGDSNTPAAPGPASSPGGEAGAGSAGGSASGSVTGSVVGPGVGSGAGSGVGSGSGVRAGFPGGVRGAGGTGHGHGTRLTGPVSGPINPHEPENNPPERPAPAARSIGWLDRFFGTQTRDDAPLQAGVGGTGTAPGAGNTNPASVRSNHLPVAAEFTTSNAVTATETLNEPPPPPVSNSPRAAPLTNALNDNFEQLLREHGAGSGDVRVSLMWSNRNDIDLHVVDPNGEEIFYGHRQARSGGLLDIDMNASPPFRVPAVENVYWPQRAAPRGQYKVYVNHYRQHDSANVTPFRVRVLVRGRTTDVTGSVQFGGDKKLVYQFTLAGASP